MSVNLENESDLVCVNIARTSSEKLMNVFHPSLVSYYAVKITDNSIQFHQLKKGAIKALKGFSDLSFEIKLDEIINFRKKPFIISFAYNIMMPRFEISLKDGQVFDMCIFKGQGMFGKAFDGDARTKLLEKLLNK